MKRRNNLLVVTTILYSFLFYHQHTGINFLLIALAVTGAFYLLEKEAFRNKTVLFVATGAIISGLGAFLYGSSLSAAAVFVALMLLPGVIWQRRVALISNSITTVATLMWSPVFVVIDAIKSHSPVRDKKSIRYMAVLVPVIFTFIFLLIYKEMNPLFEKLTEKISLDFISFYWLMFTLGGFLLAYTVFYPHRFRKLDNWEHNRKIEISQETIKPPKWNERNAFIVLFGILNLMLLAINAMDLNFLYLGAGMPEDVTHKQFVHNGVHMLILSILLGICLLLYFFRGELNFIHNNKMVKILALAWVYQNMFMVISTGIRNTMYVNQALLSYKRTGVYFWLFFALTGLFTTAIKISQNKTSWYILRHNLNIVLYTLFISTLVDWDGVISSFNLSRTMSMNDISAVDKNYLLSLSEGNIAGLYMISKMPGFEVDSAYSYHPDRYASNRQWLDHKLYEFMLEDTIGDWRSFSLRRNRVRKEIASLNDKGQLTSLNFESKPVWTLDPLASLTALKELNLSATYFQSTEQLTGINHFKQLKVLDLSNNYIDTPTVWVTNENLEVLKLEGNEIYNLEFLNNFPRLQSLDLANNRLITLASLPVLEDLTYLRLDNNSLRTINELERLPKLAELSLNDLGITFDVIPVLPHLKKLSMINSDNPVNKVLENLNNYPELQELMAGDNHLESLNLLIDPQTRLPKNPELKKLDVSGNNIKFISVIAGFSELESLNLGLNDLRDIRGISGLQRLKELNLYNNVLIEDFQELESLSRLTHLDLSKTEFRKLSHITANQSLQYLNISNCRIESWEGMTVFTQLKTLKVSFLNKEDLLWLKELPSLRSLNITNTEPDVIDFIKKSLPNVDIY